MKKISIRLLLIALICLIGVMIVPARSYAVLQANGGAIAKYNLNTWITSVRSMESIGGCLGLTETYDTNGLLATSGSNNLDCHMEKNTEYGALVLLSASAYGNPSKINSGETTTGNVTGAVMNINMEWVAASAQTMEATNYENADGRYKNIYTTNTNSAKNGDAMLKWHGGSGRWFGSFGQPSGGGSHWYGNIIGVVRAYSGSVFSYDSHQPNKNQMGSPVDPGGSNAYIWATRATRAVIVVGHNF